ncbi:hypothetical protein E2320_004487, partial [Naja naja]
MPGLAQHRAEGGGVCCPGGRPPTWLGHVQFAGKGTSSLSRLAKRRVHHASGLADPQEGLAHLLFFTRASSGLALECRAANGIPPPFPPHRHCPREPSLAPESKSCDLVPLFLHHQPPLRPPNPRLQPPPFCSPFEEETGEAQTLPQYGAPSLSYFFIGTVKAVAG